MFYAESQDGHQKFGGGGGGGGGGIFGKSNQMTADNLVVKKFAAIALLHHFRDKCVVAFYAKFQDGCQK